MTLPADPVNAFLQAALVPRDRSHSDGTIDLAESLRATHPEVESASIHAAAVLGDEAGVRRFLAADRSLATVPGGPHGWDALTHLCFSNYLKLDRNRTAGFLGAATALLEAGASANTGWSEPSHQPNPEWESVLYGAAGIARHAELTQLLLEHGGDPNDNETPYHAPEGYDNAALQVLVRSGKLNPDSLATIMIRKADWHDGAGMRWLLEQGIDPNQMSRFGVTVLHHALLRDNSIETIAMLLEAGADPSIEAKGHSAIAMAAGRGRRDVLDLLVQRGVSIPCGGLIGLVVACAQEDSNRIGTLLAAVPALRNEIQAWSAELLSGFAGNSHAGGLKHLLALGIPIETRIPRGDGYWGYAHHSTALHIAAWRLRHDSVRFLVDRGADVHARDGAGRTPLMLAVQGCVDSYWSRGRSTQSVEALLAAGAAVEGVMHPSGYDDVDRLIAAHSKP